MDLDPVVALHIESEFLSQFPLQAVEDGLAGLDFAAWKLPLQAVPRAFLALANEEPTVSLEHTDRNSRHTRQNIPIDRRNSNDLAGHFICFNRE
jgi:hypothetical protein